MESTAPNICANCGKGEEESDNLKTCTACKLVKYCNRDCQIAHRSQHKKACKKRAAELIQRGRARRVSNLPSNTANRFRSNSIRILLWKEYM